MALSDAEAFWILDEHTLAATVRVDSTANAHDWTTSNAEWAAGPCSVPNAIFYHGGTAQALSQATSAGLALGDFDWEINGWGYSSSSGGPNGAECYIAKALAFPSPLCYAVFNTSPTTPTLTLQVRDAANTANGTVSLATGIASDVWFNWGVYHDSVHDKIGAYINGGTPTTAAWSGGVLANSGDVFTTIQAYMTGRKGFRNCNMGVWRRILTSLERRFLAGLDNGGCPPTWPFEEGMAFEAYVARLQSGQQVSAAAYGAKTYLQILNPVTGQLERVSVPLDMNGVQPGELAEIKLRRDGDDPLDPSVARCTVPTLGIDYSVRSS